MDMDAREVLSVWLAYWRAYRNARLWGRNTRFSIRYARERVEQDRRK